MPYPQQSPEQHTTALHSSELPSLAEGSLPEGRDNLDTTVDTGRLERMTSTTIMSMAIGGAVGSEAGPVGTMVGAALGGALGYRIAKRAERQF